MGSAEVPNANTARENTEAILNLGMHIYIYIYIYIYICKGYNMVRRDFPDIYALALGRAGLVRIYQANPD